MALALDTSSNGASASSWSHTTTGTNRILFVGTVGDLTDTLTGITYGGVAMTLIGKLQVPTDRWIYLYYLINPLSGANTIAMSGATFNRGAAASYTGANQTGQPDASTTNTATATVITTSVTTVADNSSAIAFTVPAAGNLSAGTGTTSRQLSSAQYLLGDSNAALTPPGVKSMSVNNSGSFQMATIMASFSPFGAAATNSAFLAFM